MTTIVPHQLARDVAPGSAAAAAAKQRSQNQARQHAVRSEHVTRQLDAAGAGQDHLLLAPPPAAAAVGAELVSALPLLHLVQGKQVGVQPTAVPHLEPADCIPSCSTAACLFWTIVLYLSENRTSSMLKRFLIG